MYIYIAYLYLHIIFGKYEISLKRLIFIFIYRNVYIFTCVQHTCQYRPEECNRCPELGTIHICEPLDIYSSGNWTWVR